MILAEVSALGVSKGKAAQKERKKKVESKMSSGADRELRNAPDPGRLWRRRLFQTSKPWLIFLAFSTYLTPIVSPGPMLAIIQIC